MRSIYRSSSDDSRQIELAPFLPAPSADLDGPAWLALLRSFCSDDTSGASSGLCAAVFPSLAQLTLDVFITPRRSPYDPLVLSLGFHETMLEIARRIPALQRIAVTTARGGGKMRVLESWSIVRKESVELVAEPFGGMFCRVQTALTPAQERRTPRHSVA